MYEKEKLIIKNELEKNLLEANERIEKLESYTAITAPESSLGTILSYQTDEERELKRFYVRKRKFLYFLDKLDDVNAFLCTNCGSIIELERLLIMSKASLCNACTRI